MFSCIHVQARTIPKIRHEIKDSGLSDRQMAKNFGIKLATVAKWIKRDDVQDRSHRAHTLHATLSTAQKAIVLGLGQSLYFPLDNLLFITRQYWVFKHIYADMTERSGVDFLPRLRVASPIKIS